MTNDQIADVILRELHKRSIIGASWESDVEEIILAALAAGRAAAFHCQARHGKTDPPQDCDWPMCGCDEHATKVIEALQESGYLAAGRAAEATEPDAAGLMHNRLGPSSGSLIRSQPIARPAPQTDHAGGRVLMRTWLTEDAASSPAPLTCGTWQPIETAPKDGTSIVAWLGDVRRVAVTCWTLIYGRSRWYEYGMGGCEPTHWMPLPDPPRPPPRRPLRHRG